MDTQEKDFYDRYYYLTSCGRPYDDRQSWERSFGDMADRIIKDLHPKTVMDVGCAYGYLVAALRDRGVEAYGIDISDYAISQVREDIKPYCKATSILTPLTQSYDLIICIEVIEHLQPEAARNAIENLCLSSNNIIFTSTPSDFKEATHFNVQPTEYWVRLFGNYSFYRDVDYDASYIIEHAIMFRNNQPDKISAICNYEKKYYRYYLENKILREELIVSRAIIAQHFDETERRLIEEKEIIIRDKDIHINQLAGVIAQKEQEIASINLEIEGKNNTINSLKEECIKLHEELDSLKKLDNTSFQIYKDAHTELERIQQLNGYKLLWKYYKIRNVLLARKKAP
ncbi:MAG: methyltransferase domain-containing protein [Chitinophagaceae bacterium]